MKRILILWLALANAAFAADDLQKIFATPPAEARAAQVPRKSGNDLKDARRWIHPALLKMDGLHEMW